MRPIDLQLSLNNLSEVARREKIKLDDQKSKEVEKDLKIFKKSVGDEADIHDVDQVEIVDKVKQEHKENSKKKGRDKKEEEEGKVEKKVVISSDYKGNFLDILE